jgi:uncharacterized protein (DUF1800 family)
MTHGSAGSFDVQLPLNPTNSAIECRSVTAGMTLVLSFDQPVFSGSASITGSAGTPSVTSAPAFAGNTMTVRLGGLTNAQSFTVTLTNVANGASELLATQAIPFRTLLGDVTSNGLLTSSDVNTIKAAIAAGSGVNGSNFRCDTNLSGTLTTSDINNVKAAIATGATLNGVATANTAPTIAQVPDQTAIATQAMTPVGFTVGDAESDPATLYVSASSSDTTTVPNSSISVGGTGAGRTVTLTPAAGVTASTQVAITLVVSDGIATSNPMTFNVTVLPAPTVYLATIQPIPGVNSLGSGTATLSLSGDLTYAIIKYSYTNLAGSDTEDAIYGPGDQVLYDIPVGKTHGDLQPDGSLKWTFSAANAANIVSIIQANNAYITIDSSAFPAGEIRGTFQKVTGSQTFTPPPPPPTLAINPPTQADASRFLQQAAFGGTYAEILALSNPAAANASTALNDWLTQQFSSPLPIAPTYGDPNPTYSPSSMYQNIVNRVTTAQPPNSYGDNLDDTRVHEAWWKNAVTGQDQLRQRVATALSELFVVSEIDDTIDGNIPGLASYYDMLANDAFGNFRTLLGDVTLHPIMGEYLNMKGNKKATPPNSPNENYAREVMQLFTIGLYMLQPDGTLMLDQNGQPIPTYDQTTITQFAQVFTGWDQNNTNSVTIVTLIAPVPPSTQPTTQPFTSVYQKPMVITAGNHSTTQKNLLNYPGAATYPGASQPAVIPATASQTAASATAELNFALDNIFNHPNVGPFVCRQLIQRLVESNPSPAYVYRVAQVFNDDGSPQHARGNLQAVITAILTDYEARSPDITHNPGYGHAREPMIRLANLLRSCGGYSKDGKWQLGKTDLIGQTIFRSPTVFNFFDPHYSQPGVVQAAGLVSPEFDIIFETTIINEQNLIYTGIYSSNTQTGFTGENVYKDIYMDLTATGANLTTVAQNNGVSALIDQVGLLLNGAPLDSAVKSRIQTYIGTLSPTDYLGQARAAVHLVSTSTQAAVQK